MRSPVAISGEHRRDLGEGEVALAPPFPEQEPLGDLAAVPAVGRGGERPGRSAPLGAILRPRCAQCGRGATGAVVSGREGCRGEVGGHDETPWL